MKDVFDETPLSYAIDDIAEFLKQKGAQ